MNYEQELASIIEAVMTEGGSDIHLSANAHPTIRVSGALIQLLKKPVYTQEDILAFLDVLLDAEQKKAFLNSMEADFSYQYQEEVRFRGNAFFQRGTTSVALRLIPREIKSFEELNLPPILESFATRTQGFFLCVGPVGQGKSTTLASMIQYINNTRAEHIVTIEDPIEFIYEEDQCLIDQREVHLDTRNFASALRSVFRQDVDVIMLGEMRGPETISTAVTAAETGHLVFSTLHTNNAAQTIDRIIDSFVPAQQGQIRMQLAGSLAGIFSQRLVPRVSGGLIPAYELLVKNNAVANLIREGRSHEINTIIETSAEEGMIDMNNSLAELVRRGEISPEHAFSYSLNPNILSNLL